MTPNHGPPGYTPARASVPAPGHAPLPTNALTPPWWATTTPTAADLAERRADLDDVLASQRLAGLEPDPATVAQLRRVVSGERTPEDVLADLRARLARGER